MPLGRVGAVVGRLLVTSGASVTYYRALSLADPNFAPGPVAAIKQAPAVLTGWLTVIARCPVLLRGVVIALLGLAAWAASPTREKPSQRWPARRRDRSQPAARRGRPPVFGAPVLNPIPPSRHNLPTNVHEPRWRPSPWCWDRDSPQMQNAHTECQAERGDDSRRTLY